MPFSDINHLTYAESLAKTKFRLALCPWCLNVDLVVPGDWYISCGHPAEHLILDPFWPERNQ